MEECFLFSGQMFDRCGLHISCVFTMYVFDHVDAEAVSGDGGEHLAGAPPPGQVVGGAPGGDGTEEELEVVLLRQLLRRRHEGAELHQDLQEWSGGQDRRLIHEAEVFEHTHTGLCLFNVSSITGIIT